ncbi:MAG TPA: phosphatase PAP2 family protein [Ideonella sp.]|nr:phosphatase PAP2 family protein [Ideonella sp.]
MTTARSPLFPGPVAVTVCLLSIAIAWDASGLDMAAASWFGSASGFPLRDHWFFSTVLHEGGRLVSWGLATWLCISVWWPAGCLKRIDARHRLQLAISSLLAVLLVSGLKSISATSCPWDLAAFGRTARHVSHWTWGLAGGDGAGGHCFPAGHASAGFAFVGGYFAFRDRSPGLARNWLIVALAAGLLLGMGQQVRGAHFMSHTLWTACVCWCAALLVDAVCRQWGRQPRRARWGMRDDGRAS